MWARVSPSARHPRRLLDARILRYPSIHEAPRRLLDDSCGDDSPGRCMRRRERVHLAPRRQRREHRRRPVHDVAHVRQRSLVATGGRRALRAARVRYGQLSFAGHPHEASTGLGSAAGRSAGARLSARRGSSLRSLPARGDVGRSGAGPLARGAVARGCVARSRAASDRRRGAVAGRLDAARPRARRRRDDRGRPHAARGATPARHRLPLESGRLRDGLFVLCDGAHGARS